MASEKIIQEKQNVVANIRKLIEDSNAVVLVDYQGLSVADINDLRAKLREVDTEFKIFKNTLTKRAMDDLKYDLSDAMAGPNAIAFSTDSIAPLKVLADFAKEHETLSMKIGIIDGEVTEIDTLNQLAALPSRDGLLTMLAGGMIGIVKDLSIGLNLYAETLNDGTPVETKVEEPKEETSAEVTTEEQPEETKEVAEEVTEEKPETVEESAE